MKRALRWAGTALVALVVLLYIGWPVCMAIVTIFPARSPVGSPPAGYEEVTLQAADGVELKGWYRSPTNGAVILLLHGAGGTRESMRPLADMLGRHGYGVLMIDQRGYGESQGPINRLGWQGTLDVGAAVAFLQSMGEVRRIGGLGSSMGGEVLLGAASTYPAIQAIVTDGATRRSLDEYLALEENRPLVRNFTARVMFAAVQLFTGVQPPLPLLDSIRATQSTRFLFIAAGKVAEEASFNQLFNAALGDRASLWIAPGVDHTGAFSRYPELYEERVIDFFQTAFSD